MPNSCPVQALSSREPSARHKDVGTKTSYDGYAGRCELICLIIMHCVDLQVALEQNIFADGPK